MSRRNSFMIVPQVATVRTGIGTGRSLLRSIRVQDTSTSRSSILPTVHVDGTSAEDSIRFIRFDPWISSCGHGGAASKAPKASLIHEAEFGASTPRKRSGRCNCPERISYTSVCTQWLHRKPVGSERRGIFVKTGAYAGSRCRMTS